MNRLLLALTITCAAASNLLAQAAAPSDTPAGAPVEPPAPASASAEPETADATAEASPDETAVRAAIASYVETFNKADAKALAAHWSDAGEMITTDGTRLAGHEQLEKAFTAYFSDSPESKIELIDPSVEFLSPGVAVETGIARVVVPEQEPSESSYRAVHVKTADGWKIDSVREFAPEQPAPSHYDKLAVLEWMIGRWVDADDNAAIETTASWSENRNFIVRQFKVFIQDRVDFAGTQVIGWDPHAQAIRSWMFDSDGGFGVGRWSGGGAHWTVTTLNVLPDGRQATATNIFDLVDENTVKYHSIGRQVDGELLPNIDPVTVVRSLD